MDSRQSGARFLEALRRRSFDDLEALLSPEVEFRILVPAGLRYCTGAAKTADYFRGWFGTGTVERRQDCNGEPYPDMQTTAFAVLEDGVGEAVEHRVPFHYRLDLHNKRGHCMCQQNGFLTVDPSGRIGRLDIVCSGIVPLAS